jgi:hypothetical protein
MSVGLPRIDRRGISLMLSSSAAAVDAGVSCITPLSAGVLMGVDMAAHGVVLTTGGQVGSRR